jgi:hypothetical protein
MSKFRRVSDTEGIPSYLEDKFVGASAQNEDPYAHLRSASQENQVRIAKQQLGNHHKEEPAAERSWEAIKSASIYKDRREMDLDERLAALEAEDFSPYSVKRAGYGIDASDSTREVTSGLKAFSAEDYMNVMLRGGSSIWEPDMYKVAESFMESQEQNSEQAIADASQRRMARKNQHDNWEQEKSAEISSLRKPTVLSGRAGSIVRTAIEQEAAGNFGMMDFDELDAREANRIAMQNEQREQRLAFKGKHMKDRNQRHTEWENDAESRARTANDIYNHVALNFNDNQE